jgi:hypothetical protein
MHIRRGNGMDLNIALFTSTGCTSTHRLGTLSSLGLLKSPCKRCSVDPCQINVKSFQQTCFRSLELKEHSISAAVTLDFLANLLTILKPTIR